jgi:hypothetical protein
MVRLSDRGLKAYSLLLELDPKTHHQERVRPLAEIDQGAASELEEAVDLSDQMVEGVRKYDFHEEDEKTYAGKIQHHLDYAAEDIPSDSVGRYILGTNYDQLQETLDELDTALLVGFGHGSRTDRNAVRIRKRLEDAAEYHLDESVLE